MENHLDFILNILKTIGLLAATVWAIWRFRIESPYKPRIELNVDMAFLGPQSGQYIAGINIEVNNKGTVNHTIDHLELNIRGIKVKTSLQLHSDKDKNGSVYFPELIFKSDNIINAKYQYYFLRAGVQQTIYYHTLVPEDICFVRVWAAFHYKGIDKNEKHTVERIFEIKEINATNI